MNNLPILLNEYEVSKWAYEYCRRIKDDPEIRKYIVDSFWAYCYCRDTNDDPEVRKNITRSYFAFCYCRDVKNDPQVRKYITKEIDRELYFIYFKEF